MVVSLLKDLKDSLKFMTVGAIFQLCNKFIKIGITITE